VKTGKNYRSKMLDATGPKIEVSFSAVGTYAGIDCTNTGTYWTIPIAADAVSILLKATTSD
jgi:hypothetical protein